MSTIITGIVTDGVIVPNSPLAEGTRVKILPQSVKSEDSAIASPRITPDDLRKMPRERRQAFLAIAAELAEQDYRDDKELTGFDAFSEEEVGNDAIDSHYGRGVADPFRSCRRRRDQESALGRGH
jgi:hypothetical protein